MDTKKERLEMFNIKEQIKRIGPTLQKNKFLGDLKPVEEFFVDECIKRGIDHSYDVTASQYPEWETLGYTEYATNFIVAPLNNDLRRDMVMDSLLSPEPSMAWDKYYQQIVLNKQANKYSDRKSSRKKVRDSLLVPVGTNKFLQVLDIQKMIDICETENAFIKPHPLTTHEYVGMLKDKCGEVNVLDRDDDLYQFLSGCKKVYSTHYSESMLYAAMLGKDIDVIDKLGQHYKAGFWHYNSHILRTPKEARIPQLNKILSSFHSGVFNPRVDKDWKSKMTMYLDYIEERRDHFAGMYRHYKK